MQILCLWHICLIRSCYGSEAFHGKSSDETVLHWWSCIAQRHEKWSLCDIWCKQFRQPQSGKLLSRWISWAISVTNVLTWDNLGVKCKSIRLDPKDAYVPQLPESYSVVQPVELTSNDLYLPRTPDAISIADHLTIFYMQPKSKMSLGWHMSTRCLSRTQFYMIKSSHGLVSTPQLYVMALSNLIVQSVRIDESSCWFQSSFFSCLFHLPEALLVLIVPYNVKRRILEKGTIKLDLNFFREMWSLNPSLLVCLLNWVLLQ